MPPIHTHSSENAVRDLILLVFLMSPAAHGPDIVDPATSSAVEAKLSKLDAPMFRDR